MNRTSILQAVARGWVTRENAKKPMDADLAIAITYEVEKYFITCLRSQVLMSHAIKCPDDDCCGVLIQAGIIGVAECNECKECYVVANVRPQKRKKRKI